MKGVVVLGSTGSVGTQTLDVLGQFPDRFRVVGLAANRNATALSGQATRFGVENTSLFDQDGIEGLVRLATLPEADIVVVAVAGVIGLLPTLRAIAAGKQIALASKEVLVAAGAIVMPLAKDNGVKITPIDSEHSALFQCLEGYRPDQVESLILTASGGPFRGKKLDDLKAITVSEALNHPTWRMGGKITIDSATLMNKGLEMIEAKWLFGVEMSQVEVVIHPQSIVHSMVRFKDGSVLGQLGNPDMRLPIAYSLLYPERIANDLPAWNPVATPTLTFESVDEETFPSLQMARNAVQAGGTMPCVLNAANEEVTNAFLRGEVRFLDIFDIVSDAMGNQQPEDPILENLLATDQSTRESVRKVIDSHRLDNRN